VIFQFAMLVYQRVSWLWFIFQQRCFEHFNFGALFHAKKSLLFIAPISCDFSGSAPQLSRSCLTDLTWSHCRWGVASSCFDVATTGLSVECHGMSISGEKRRDAWRLVVKKPIAAEVVPTAIAGPLPMQSKRCVPWSMARLTCDKTINVNPGLINP